MKKVDRAPHSQTEELVELMVKLSVDSIRKLDEHRFREGKKGKNSSLDAAVESAIALLSPDPKQVKRKRTLKIYTLPEVTGQKVIGFLLRTGRDAFQDGCSIEALAKHVNAVTGKYNMGSINQNERAGRLDAPTKSIRYFNQQYVADVLSILDIPLSVQEVGRIGRGELLDSSQVILPLVELIESKRSSLGLEAFRKRYLELGLTDGQIEFAKQGFIKSDCSAAIATLLGVSQEQCLAMSIAQLHKRFVEEARETINEVERLRSR